MNVESFISFFGHSNWVLLASLIVALGAAFAVSFSEKPVPNQPSGQASRRPR